MPRADQYRQVRWNPDSGRLEHNDQAGRWVPITVAATVTTAELGSGTADSTTFLRGDRTWAVPAGGGSGLSAAQVGARLILGV